MAFTNQVQTKKERMIKYQFIRLTGLNPSNARVLRDYDIRPLIRYLYHAQGNTHLKKEGEEN